jgi:hypothetical protein
MKKRAPAKKTTKKRQKTKQAARANGTSKRKPPKQRKVAPVPASRAKPSPPVLRDSGSAFERSDDFADADDSSAYDRGN